MTHDSNGRFLEVGSHLYRASQHEYRLTLDDSLGKSRLVLIVDVA
jgi:hypothetical protein